MIDVIRAWFEAFVDAHAMGDPEHDGRLALKRRHSLLVMEEAQALALDLELDGHLAELATIAGLTHDVGRFPQYRRYGTFRDADSVNHAVLGLQAMTRHGALSGLTPVDRRLVRGAIVAHNRRTLPKAILRGRDAQALTLARIVRDADKLDIVRVMLEHFKAPGPKDPVVFLGLPEEPERFNPALIDAIEAGRLGDYYAMTSINDFALLLLSWINDLSFDRSRRLFFERGYVRALCDELPDFPRIRSFTTRYHERFAPQSSGI